MRKVDQEKFSVTVYAGCIQMVQKTAGEGKESGQIDTAEAIPFYDCFAVPKTNNKDPIYFITAYTLLTTSVCLLP